MHRIFMRHAWEESAVLLAYGGQGMYGARVHAATLASGETTTGVTVYMVDGE